MSQNYELNEANKLMKEEIEALKETIVEREDRREAFEE